MVQRYGRIEYFYSDIFCIALIDEFFQTTLLKERFIRALQDYQKVEQQHRDKQKERVARQFKIVKQDASPEEITAVVNDAMAGSNQIFAQAVCIIIMSAIIGSIKEHVYNRFHHQLGSVMQELPSAMSRTDRRISEK